MAIGTPTKIAEGQENVLDASITVTTTVTAAVGENIIVVVLGDGGMPDSVQDSAGNTYSATPDVSRTESSANVAIFSARVTTQLSSGGTITATWDPTIGTKQLSAYSVTGLESSALDKTAANGSFSDADWDSTATATTVQADELIIGACAQNSVASATSTPTDPPNELADFSQGSNSLTVTYKIVSATGTYSATGTWSSSALDWAAVVATYKGAAGEEPIPAYVPARRVPKRLAGPAQLTNSAATKYTAPDGYRAMIRSVHVSNPTGAAVDFTLSIGTDAAGTRLYDGYSIAADSYKRWFLQEWLEPGEIIQAFASTGAALVLTIDGFERPAG